MTTEPAPGLTELELRAELFDAMDGNLRMSRRKKLLDAYREAVLAAAPVPPPADQTGLRERIAETMARADGWEWAAANFSSLTTPTADRYRRCADAVLAVLPEPTDRAASYHLAADAVRDTIAPADWNADAVSTWNTATNIAEHRLRRLAAEAQQPDTETPTAADVHLMLTRMRASASTHDLGHLLRLIADWYRSSEGRDVLVDDLIAAGYRLPEGDEPAAEAQPTTKPETEPEFTEARAAFMQIGRTPSLEGLRAELHIEGWPPIIGRYCGAAMGRMHNVPGHEHLLAIDPRLIFEYAGEQPAAGVRQDGAQS